MNDLNFEPTNFWAGDNEQIARLQNDAAKIVEDKTISVKYLETTHALANSIKEITVLPRRGEQIRIITQKSFNAYSILLYLLAETGNLKNCYLTTYNIDKNTIQSLAAAVRSGKIENLTLLVSNSINFRMPARARELTEAARVTPNFKLIFAWNHTKILCAETSESEPRFFVCEGSGNLSDNARIEQYLFEENKTVFDFHKNWIDNIQSVMQTENTIKIIG